VSDRALAWDGCRNVRDLGGLRLRDGGRTRPGVVVRSDSLTRLTPAGRDQALAFGVTGVIDLRAGDEKEPGERWPDGVRVVANPVLPGSPDDPLWPEFGAIFASAPDAERGLRAVYLAFLERWPCEFASAVGAMAGRRDGAVVVHCNAGRDRAGLVSALLLDAVGVERGEIAADFASSPSIEGHPGASAWVMLEVLEALDRTAGGSRGYLATAGLDPAALETVGLL
jgi:protein-tyrosine phosphatase